MQQLRIHIDEAGRGPLAGPVSVGSVLSLQNFDKSVYQDSKQLSHNQRLSLHQQLIQDEEEGNLLVATGRGSARMIDRQGIIATLQYACLRSMFILLKKYFYHYRQPALLASVHGEDTLAEYELRNIFATARGGKDAVKSILHMPNSIASFPTLLIDGNHSFGLEKVLDIHVVTIIQGDSKNPLISAASIAAKVERDAYMTKAHKKFPNYNFAQHKGYGTMQHRQAIRKYGCSPLHRRSFCGSLGAPQHAQKTSSALPKIRSRLNTHLSIATSSTVATNVQKPKLLLHICCAPDLSRPLHRLKEHFKLYLFWYNPNIHPRQEHSKRYDAFIKLIGLEKGDYEIIEDRYDPKEFFAAMIEEREDIDPKLKHATKKAVLAQAGEMEERSSRCNPCYSMRLAEAAKNAAQHDIDYFTSTLLISPKKKMDKLMRRGLEGERRHPSTKFLWFDFAKNGGYDKASKLTKKHGLYRQNYCGCGWTIPKKGEENTAYRGG